MTLVKCPSCGEQAMSAARRVFLPGLRPACGNCKAKLVRHKSEYALVVGAFFFFGAYLNQFGNRFLMLSAIVVVVSLVILFLPLRLSDKQRISSE